MSIVQEKKVQNCKSLPEFFFLLTDDFFFYTNTCEGLVYMPLFCKCAHNDIAEKCHVKKRFCRFMWNDLFMLVGMFFTDVFPAAFAVW